MLLSELITIYLAAAAPVGVIYFLRYQTSATRVETSAARRNSLLLRAASAGLVWPLALLALWLERGRVGGGARGETEAGADEVGRVEPARRALVAALHQTEDLLAETFGASCDGARRALAEARGSVERYTGLALAAREASADAEPSAREMELCRVAGRRGEDLLRAGRCVHRTNVARLVAHRERARTELLHALAEVREALTTRMRLAAETEVTNASAATRLSASILQAYGRAVELLSLLEDERATLSVARLLDAECARLRRLEASLASDTAALRTERVSVRPREDERGEVCSTEILRQSPMPRRELSTASLSPLQTSPLPSPPPQTTPTQG